MNIAPLIQISKEEFEAHAPERNQSAMFYIDERGWFKTADEKYIASIEVSTSCDDWSYSIYEVRPSDTAPEISIGCDRNSEARIKELLIASIRKLYRKEDEK